MLIWWYPTAQKRGGEMQKISKKSPTIEFYVKKEMKEVHSGWGRGREIN
jgi:hypothetical protein